MCDVGLAGVCKRSLCWGCPLMVAGQGIGCGCRRRACVAPQPWRQALKSPGRLPQSLLSLLLHAATGIAWPRRSSPQAHAKGPVPQAQQNLRTSAYRAALLLCAPAVQETAQRALISYLRSVFLQPNHAVFDVAALPAAEFAHSMGLPTAPKLRFLKRAGKKVRRPRLARSLPPRGPLLTFEMAAGRGVLPGVGNQGTAGLAVAGPCKLTLTAGLWGWLHQTSMCVLACLA
jgi:hypothetical protein